MSSYRAQLNDWLQEQAINVEKVLSIGKEENDRKFFKSFTAREFTTLDNNPSLSPDILWDMNQPMVDWEGEMIFPVEWIGSFDVVIALNLFDYIYDPVTAHRILHELLNTTGELYVCYPFVYPVHNPPGIDYLRYTPEGVKKLLSLAKFEIVDWQELYGSNRLTEFYWHENMHARKRINHNIIGVVLKAKKI
jgi:SAM-dependent methyltransferase